MKNSGFIYYVIFLTLLCCFFQQGCSSGGGNSWRYDPGIPSQVTNLKAASGDKTVSLSWDGISAATSYNIYYVSESIASEVTKTNGTKITVTTKQAVIEGLDNNTKYLFMVTGVNRDGEGVASAQASATPSPISNADLTGTWYFHTLVTGQGAKWERGKISVTMDTDGINHAVISDFEDSAGSTQAPQEFILSVNENTEVVQSGAGAWPYFHGMMGSRKNMMVATFSPSLSSRAITVFQKQKSAGEPDYSITDICGTGSEQNPDDPTLQGNGPTRFAYHQLSSGTNIEWEYGNAKIGQHGTWLEKNKDVIYWDYSTPDYKTAPGYDILRKSTSLGIDKDGLVTEYWNYWNIVNQALIPGTTPVSSYNYLAPKVPHEVLFTGRMTADRTVIVGVGTRTDASGANPIYFLRIIELCFIPSDQALPATTLTNLAGNYRFGKLGASVSASGTIASSAHGKILITNAGLTSFPEFSDGVSTSSDTFTFSYYPDPGSDGKQYSDFANFTTPAQIQALRYRDGSGNPYHLYYDFWSTGCNINRPETWRSLSIPSANGDPISSYYYNEHGTLSYNHDLFVLTRTDVSGNAMIIALK